MSSASRMIGLMYLAAVVARLIGFTVTSSKDLRD